MEEHVLNTRAAADSVVRESNIIVRKNVDLACETAEIIKKYLILIYSQTFFDLQILQTAKIALRHLMTY